MAFEKTFEAYISGIKKYFSLISEPVSAFEKMFQFKKCGITYERPLNLLVQQMSSILILLIQIKGIFLDLPINK